VWVDNDMLSINCSTRLAHCYRFPFTGVGDATEEELARYVGSVHTHQVTFKGLSANRGNYLNWEGFGDEASSYLFIGPIFSTIAIENERMHCGVRLDKYAAGANLLDPYSWPLQWFSRIATGPFTQSWANGPLAAVGDVLRVVTTVVSISELSHSVFINNVLHRTVTALGTDVFGGTGNRGYASGVFGGAVPTPLPNPPFIQQPSQLPKWSWDDFYHGVFIPS